MADYIAQPDTAVDPDAPVTSDLMYALRDNPIAIAEGASGAPRVRQSALLAPVSGTAFFVGDASASVSSGGNVSTVRVVGRCLVPGVVRYSISATIGTGSVSLLLGSSVVATQSSVGTITGNVTVPYGEHLSLRVAPPTAGTQIGTVTITCGNDAPRVYL